VLVVPLVTAGDLQLHHCAPELLIRTGRRIECTDDHLPVLARMRPYLRRLGDEADGLLDVVPADAELFASRAGRAVDAVPREGPVAHARLVAELGLEEPLPTRAVPGGGRIFEQEQVPPVVRRVARRAHQEIAVALLHDPLERQRVEVRRPDERPRHPLAQRFASLSSHEPTTRDQNCGCSRKPSPA
jgi:hypothetical protein